jgi:tryptophan 2-monooxygenase
MSNEFEQFIPWPYLDSMYDYLPYLQWPIAHLPPQRYDAPVAIVGAGAAGLVAAYELMRIGLRPIIFEATERIGGRLYTQPFTESDGRPSQAFAELGAMRIPISSRVFYHYAGRFQLEHSTLFPDPGLVDTLLCYRGQASWWAGGTAVPVEFHAVQQNWEYFITPLIQKLHEPWRRGDWQAVERVWQTYIERYKDKSFYQVIRNESAVWTIEDLNRFGALGIGTGGFGPLYHIGFTEILRIILHGWESQQKLITRGVSELPQQFLGRQEKTPLGYRSVQQAGELHRNTPVTSMRLGPDGNPIITYRDPHTHSELEHEFSAVIIATASRAMQMLGLTLPDQHLLPETVKEALRNLHHMSSSKLFIRTAEKFWRNSPERIPLTILTDELPRAVYLLDYAQTANGVVCMSYTWGDDSTKLLSLSPEEYFDQCQRMINRYCPAMASHLIPVNDEILSIHWESTPYYHGAFKLQLPGQDANVHQAYFQFLSALNPETDRGVYLAGDSVSWSGGWVEGALHTGINAAAAVARRLGGDLGPNSPLDQHNQRYHYL